MANEEKTEKATPRRKGKAREEGKIPRSKELGIFLNLLSFAIVLLGYGNWFVQQIVSILTYAFSIISTNMKARDYLFSLGWQAGKVLLIVLLMILASQALNHFIQVRFIITWKALKVDFKRIDPMNYFRNLTSIRTFVEIGKSVIMLTIISAIVYFTMKGKIDDLTGAVMIPWQQSLVLIWGIFQTVVTRLLTLVFIVAIGDYIFQKWNYNRSLKMTKQEVKDEHKEMMGDPQMKMRQRNLMINMLKQKALTEVKNGTALIANPTHYSVVFRWEKDKDPVPRVIIKGVDEVALFMREIAKENNIPIVENPPLARELYSRVKEDDFIPEDMYMAVIAVLKYLMDTNQIERK